MMSYLNQFISECESNPGPIKYSYLLGDPSSPNKFLLFSAIHGNETGAIEAFLSFIHLFKEKLKNCSFIFVLGNPEAALKNIRYVKNDLNRLFLDLYRSEQEYEYVRSKEIMSIIVGATAIIDFHQTIERNLKPFYIFNKHKSSYEFARSLGKATDWIIDDTISEKEKCLHLYAQELNIPAISIETGQLGEDTQQAKFCLDIIHRLLDLVVKSDEGKISFESQCEISANLAPDFEKWKMTSELKRTHFRDVLNDGLENFMPIKKNHLIGHSFSDGDLRSPVDGIVLFPKYQVYDQEKMKTQSSLPSLCTFAVRVKDIHFTQNFVDIGLLQQRCATNDDARDIRSLIFIALSEFGISYEPFGIDGDLFDIEENYFQNSGYFQVLVDENNAILGTGGFIKLNDSVCEMRKVYFSSKIRGRGLANNFILSLLNKAKQLGYQRIELEATKQMQVAQHIYKKMGFTEMQRSKLSSGADCCYYLDL